ncbi:hypothetical protein C8R46DRAFT_1025454 [Mycena filopes]|nr:hypothetical protein C8R46DRAFT_1025454 [Mycena filopes]
MAPVLVTTLAMPMPVYPELHLPTYPSFTHVFHFPIPSTISPVKQSPVSTASTSMPSAALDAILIIAILLALLGTSGIAWICYRRRTRVPSASELAVGEGSRNVMMQEAHIIPNTWDSSHAFWVKRAMPAPNLITSAQTKMNAALLSEVPNVWRILGRPNVATTEDDEEAIPAIRKTAT